MTRSILSRCWDSHRQTGTLGWPIVRPLPMGFAHASFAVCDREECRQAANRQVRKATGHDGVFVSYAEARARSGRVAPEPDPLTLFPLDSPA